MTFTLHVDAELWRGALKNVQDNFAVVFGDEVGGQVLVPVIEGNSYGIPPGVLANEAANLGVASVAVGNAYQAVDVAEVFPSEILVRQPWDPRDSISMRAWEGVGQSLVPRVIRTVASAEALHRLAAEASEPVPVVLAGLTSVHGAGLHEPELDAMLADDTVRTALAKGFLDVRGMSLDLPLTEPSSPQVSTIGTGTAEDALPKSATNRVREAWGWAVIWIRALAAIEAARVPLTPQAATLWLRGLTESEIADIHTALDVLPMRVLAAGELWNAAPDSTVAYGTVLGVHPVEKGRELGHAQRRAPRDGYVVVLAGGTSHGVGLVIDPARPTLRDRMSRASAGAMAALGRHRSPFTWAGQERMFLEPPGPSESLIWLSDSEVNSALAGGHRTPAVGDQWPCRTDSAMQRYDQVLGLD